MKLFEGKVVSAKSQNTVIVSVVRSYAHPLYKKILKRSKKYKVDSSGAEVSLGDKVKIVETRPISKDKYFKIAEVIK